MAVRSVLKEGDQPADGGYAALAAITTEPGDTK
jgi:hypothetical protein